MEGDRLTGRFLDDTGLIRDSFTMVKDTATPPQADFTANPRAGVAPFDVVFEDLSTTNTASWSWDLDGDSIPESAEPFFSAQYAAAGTYDVSLTVSNNGGSDVELRSGYICAASSAPPEVTDVIWLVDGDRLEWPNIPGAAHYDVVRGNLGVLTSSSGDFSAAVTSCLADDTTVSFMTEDGDPEPAEGWFYLVRSAGECDLQGTYDQDLPPQAAPRDQGVAASGSGCGGRTRRGMCSPPRSAWAWSPTPSGGAHSPFRAPACSGFPVPEQGSFNRIPLSHRCLQD